MHLIKNNTKQYEKELQPLIRHEGTWIEPKDFFKCLKEKEPPWERKEDGWSMVIGTIRR